MMTTEQKFMAAVDVITSLPKNGPFQPSEEVMLKFNSYYKQATLGPCNVSKPLLFDQRKREWHAWNSLGNMSKEIAMEKYIEQLLEVIETMSYTETVSNFIDLMGPFYELVNSEDGIDSDNPKSGDHSPESSLNGSLEMLVSGSPPEVVSSVETISNESFEVVPRFSDTSEKFVAVEKFNTHQSDSVVSSSSESPKSCESPLPQSVPKICSDNEILSASIISLQKSLNDVIQHIDYLEHLADTYECQVVNSSKYGSWSLGPFSIAVVVFWPFVAHWIIHVIQQRRNIG